MADSLADNRLTAEIKGFIETSFLDWPGKVASVIFLAGCNFRCPYCHNYGLVLNPEVYPTLEWEPIKKRLSKFLGWVDGVVVTGGEPTLSNGLAGLLRDIKDTGFKVKLDTNGSRPAVLKALFDEDLVDHVAMDVKSPLDDFSYARASGRHGFLSSVLKSLDILEKSGKPYTLRTTVVPGLHTEEDIFRLAGQIREAPEWRLQNFKPDDAMDSSFRSVPALEPEVFQSLVNRVANIRLSRPPQPARPQMNLAQAAAR